MAEVLTKDRTRKQWLDALRALAMLFVIYGHFYREDYSYFYWTGPVKIPLFFVISGYLLGEKDDSLKAFFGRVLKGLVIPWLFLALLPELLYMPFKGVSYFLTALGQILTGEKYWYMPCCIIAQSLFVLSRKLTRKTWLLCVVSLGLTVIGYIAASCKVLDIFAFNTAMVCQSFLLLGLLLNKLEGKLQGMKLWMPFACIAGYVAAVTVGVLLFPGQGMDVQHSVYYSIPLCALQIVLGSVALFALAPKLKRYPKALTFVGQNTLVFYIYHTWGRTVLEVALQVLGVTLPDTWYVGLAMAIVACVGCGIGAALLNWLLPEAVGKKRMKKVSI